MAGEGGALGRGGMITKVRAARLAARSGTETIIAGGGSSKLLPGLPPGPLSAPGCAQESCPRRPVNSGWQAWSRCRAVLSSMMAP